MNLMYPDHLDELNRQKIERDRIFILKEEMIKPKSEITHLLDALGNWMIAKGEKLHKRYSATTQISKPAFFQDESRIFRA